MPEIVAAGRRFEDYREDHLWGPWVDEDGRKVRHGVNVGGKLWKEGFHYHVHEADNEWATRPNDQWATWEAALVAGRCYMVGEGVPLDDFIRRHSVALTEWQKLAFQWCLANPAKCLCLRSARGFKREYEVYKRGEYVTIALPHHDAGGEKHWITRNGKNKILINVD